MKLNQAGLDLIKKYEGLKLEAYLCPANIWTIGYGTTKYPHGQKVKEGDKITEAQAEEYLKQHALQVVPNLTKLIEPYVELNENQFSALVSFIYNVGIGAFRESTLFQKIKEKKLKEVPNELKKWHKAGGKSLPGLVRRRIEEIHLWDKLV